MRGHHALDHGGGLRSRVRAWVEALKRGGLALDRAAVPWCSSPNFWPRRPAAPG